MDFGDRLLIFPKDHEYKTCDKFLSLTQQLGTKQERSFRARSHTTRHRYRFASRRFI